MAYQFEHFDGALPADWTAITAGTGAVSVSDSNVRFTLNASGDGAAIYKPFDPTRSQVFLCSGRSESASTPQPTVQIVHSASAPTCDLRANILQLFRCLLYTSASIDYQRLNYVDTGGTTQQWQESSQSWATGGSVISVPAPTPRDDYRTWGFEWDAAGQQVRLFAMHTVSGTAENADYGPRLVTLTDWVNLSDIRNGTSGTLWLVLGWPETNFFASASSAYIEWCSETWGPLHHVLANGKATVGSAYNITHHQGRDFRAPFFLPGTRGAIAIDKGSPGQWDDNDTQWGSVVVDDDGTFVASYAGDAGATVITIGIATASDPASTWTKQGQMIPQGPPGSTYEQYMRFNVLVKDWQEPDPQKRWKLVVNATDGSSVTRSVLFSAPTRTGTFVYEGVILEDDGTETGIAYRGQPVWWRGRWHLFYNATVGGVNVVRRAMGKYLRPGAFTKEGVTLNTQGTNSVESSITAVSGRTVTVPSTTGFVKDMLLVITNSASSDTYGLARLRKVLSSTQLELYHSVPGMTTTSVIRSANFGTDNALNHVKRIDNVWYYIMTCFKSFTSHPSFGAHCETNGVFEGGARPEDPMAILWGETPLVPLGRDSWNTTISNENVRVAEIPPKFADALPVRRRHRSTLLRR